MRNFQFFFLITIVFFWNCSSPERSKVVDVYMNGDPKELEIYEGNPPKRKLARRMFLSPYQDTMVVIDLRENDTIVHEIEKLLVIEKHKNDTSKLVHKIILKGLEETLVEVQYFDDTGDTLKIENKVEGYEKSYLDLHENLNKTEGLKVYLQGKWEGFQTKTGKRFMIEYQGSSSTFKELDRGGNATYEEVTATNYEWNFIVRHRVMRGFPKEKIEKGKTYFRSLTVLTKYQFRLGDKKGPIVFDKVL